MTRKTVIQIVRADADSLMGGATVAQRISEVSSERGITLEVFVFAGAQRALTDPRRDEFNTGIDALVAANVPVTACLNFALKLGAADQLTARGIQLEAAREAFIRYTLENATVITI